MPSTREALADVERELDALKREAIDAVRAASGVDLTNDSSPEDWERAYRALTPEQLAEDEERIHRHRALEARRVELRREFVLEQMAAGHVEGPPTPIIRKETPMSLSHASPEVIRSAALKVVESVDDARSADRLVRIIRSETVNPAESRYLAAVGSQHYASAWRRIMQDPQRAMYELSDAERAAMTEVRAASELRAMSTGGTGGADGGFALPVLIDPTIVLTNDGATDPLRQLATVRTITQKTQKFVSSDGVTAVYGSEGSAVATVSPTLAQPEVTAHRATAFVRISYELFADWSGAIQELRRVFADSKLNLEATKFATGLGDNSDEPEGIITGLTPTADVPTTVAHLEAAQEALGPRYQPNARWLLDLASINAVYQFVKEADASHAKITTDTTILRKPFHEVSNVGTSVIYGDIRAGFTIVDRLGMTVEIVQHTVNSDGVPDGNRGVLAIWRSGSAVTNPDALVLLDSGFGS